MSEPNQSFEEMAIAEQKGLRPQENYEDRQFSMDEVKAENKLLSTAKEYVAKGQIAKEAGDQEALKVLNDQIMADPVMTEFMRQKGIEMSRTQDSVIEEKLPGTLNNKFDEEATLSATHEHSGEINLSAIKSAVAEFQGNINRMYQISVQANAEIGRSILTVFNEGQGVNMVAKAEAFLKEITAITTKDEMETKLTELKNWFEPIQTALEKKFTSLRNYASGDPNGAFPNEESSTQYGLYRQMVKDMENVLSYFQLVKDST